MTGNETVSCHAMQHLLSPYIKSLHMNKHEIVGSPVLFVKLFL